jgi:NTE family protein
MAKRTRSRVGIACQGGGSHTAFTAGVLEGLLESLPGDVEVAGLSGTSGGAICASLAWSGLVQNDPKGAIRKLRSFWHATAARDPVDQFVNQALMGLINLRDVVSIPEISPYYLPTWGEEKFRDILNAHFDFEALRGLARKPGAPVLMIGAVEVLGGHFELFSGEELSADCLLASSAIPDLYRAVVVPGRGTFWDGLFSQNPPIHDLARHEIDELWVIQINSSTSATVPTEAHEIFDRRNQLSGNLSMEQELGFIKTFNRAIAKGTIKDPRYRPIRVSRIALDRDLGYRSKLDRRPELLEELMDYGRTRWRWFARERENQRLESGVEATA